MNLDEALRCALADGAAGDELVALGGAVVGAHERALDAAGVAQPGEPWALFDATARGDLEVSWVAGLGEARVAAAWGEGRLGVLESAIERAERRLARVGEPRFRWLGGADFEVSGEARFALPRIAFERTAGQTWVTLVAARRDVAALASRALAALAASPREEEAGAPARVVDDGRDAYARGVELALGALERGELEKVVLARRIAVEPAPAVGELARRLEGLTGTVRFARLSPRGQGLAVATPELLVEAVVGGARTEALAGTAPRALGDAGVRVLLESDKEAREHEIVAAAIEAALRDRAPRRGERGLRSLASVHHLATRIDFERGGEGALGLAARLHPTPALGGAPRERALAFVARAEGAPRGPYGGPVGHVNAAGEGALVVAIRGAVIDGARAVAHVGAGLVRGSSVVAELAETEAKAAPILRALGVEAS